MFFLSYKWAALTVLRSQTGNKRILFDVMKDGQNVAPKFVPDEEQEPNESRRSVA